MPEQDTTNKAEDVRIKPRQEDTENDDDDECGNGYYND